MNNLVETGKKLRYCMRIAGRAMVHLNLQILYKCNFKCNICDFWRSPEFTSLPELSAAQARQMAEKLRPIGPLIVSIGGGEPLMHPEVEEITKAFSRDHFPVMITNGWYITPAKARALFEAGMHEVSVSVDYADPARHDAQRGVPGSWERAVSALKILNENRVKPGQRVHMITVVMEDNLDDIEKLIELSASMGITYLVTLYSTGRGRRTGLQLSTELSSRLLALKKKHRNFVALRGYLGRFSEAAVENNSISPCYAGVNLFNIDSSGNVTRCIDSLNSTAGNILTGELPLILERLRKFSGSEECGGCWTSCRGAIETLLYGKGRIGNLVDMHALTREVPLGREF